MKNKLTTKILTLVLSIFIISGCAPTPSAYMENPSTLNTQFLMANPVVEVAVDIAEAAVTISPTSGPSGTLVQVTVSGFSPNAPVIIALGPLNSEFSQVAQGETDASGVFIAQVPVEGALGMDFIFAAASEDQPGVFSPDHFSIVDIPNPISNPVVSILPASGSSGTLVQVTASGFPPNSAVSVFQGPANSEFSETAQGMTDANGAFTTQVLVQGGSGMNIVFGVALIGQRGVLSPIQFHILNAPPNPSPNPAVTISPASGSSGTLVQVFASGFTPNSPVTVLMGPANSEFSQVIQGMTDASGDYSAQVLAQGAPGMNLMFAVAADGKPPILSPVQFQIIFAVPNPSIATPTPYLDMWNTFSSPAFAVALEYPADWQPVSGYGSPETGEIRFAGVSGFFQVGSMDSDSIDQAAAAEAKHKLQPYGSSPTIESLQIQGQEARLIMPSTDQSMPNQAALIVRYPFVATLVWSPRYFVLYADISHIRTIAETLRFIN